MKQAAYWGVLAAILSVFVAAWGLTFAAVALIVTFLFGASHAATVNIVVAAAVVGAVSKIAFWFLLPITAEEKERFDRRAALTRTLRVSRRRALMKIVRD